MRDYKLTIEDGIITLITNWEETDGSETDAYPARLFIPRDVTGIDGMTIAIMGSIPEHIEVEEGNTEFFALGDCLYTTDGALHLISRHGWIPDDERVKAIGNMVLRFTNDELELSDLSIPASVEYVGFMALSRNDTTFVFKSDPELCCGVFGTKAEAADSDREVYRSMPDTLYTKPETLLVIAAAGSGVEAYCRKYGIPFEAAK